MLKAPQLRRRAFGRSGPEGVGAGYGRPRSTLAAGPAFEKPPKVISDLLKIALEHDESRRWLLTQPWEEVLPRIGGSDLLYHALTAELTAGDAAATNAFMATLPPAEESFVTALLADKPYPHPLHAARIVGAAWRKLSLRERLVALESRLRLSETSPEETARLQKEILDLHLRLKQLTRL